MKITVIIAVRDMAATLGRQLEALARQSERDPVEVVVVDNGSRDDLQGALRRWQPGLPHLRVVPAHEGPSGAQARNVGAGVATGDAFAFCDADDLIGPRWLEAMSEALDHHDLVTGPLDYTRLNPPPIARLLSDAGVEAPPVAYRFLPYAIGANVAVRRELFQSVGGFRPKFRTGYDLDFCWRAQLSGAQLHFAPHALVHRQVPAGLLGLTRRQARYATAAPKFYADFREHGMPPSSPIRAVGDWVALGLRSPELVVAARRGPWCMRVGHRAGRLVGSLRARVLFL